MTSPGLFSDYLVHSWLADFARCWVSLHADNPDTAGAYASEVIGGAYTRQRGSFSSPSNRAVWNTNALVFLGLPATIITYVSAWDVQFNGNYLGAAPLSDPVRVQTGGRYEIPSGVFAFSIR